MTQEDRRIERALVHFTVSVTSRNSPALLTQPAMDFQEEAAEWIRVGTLVAIWVAVLYFNRTPRTIGWSSIEQLPAVISIYAVVSYGFTHRLWRWRALQGWLVERPDIGGTWEGEIHSTWHDESGEEPAAIAAVLVVEQTFLSVHCTLHTRDSESYSTAAQMRKSAAGGYVLTYNYVNRPRAAVRDRFPIHDGAAILRIVGRGRRVSLEGEYWTNRHTTGDMQLRFRSRASVEFPARSMELLRKAS